MDEVRKRLQPYYLILLAILLQGLSPVLTKLLLDRDHLSASTVVAARYAVAVLFLLPFGLRGPDLSSRHGPPRRRDWVALIFVGGFGSAIGTLLFTQALGMAPAGVVNALSKTAPIFVAFLAYYALRERVSSLRFTLVFVMVAADLLIGLGEVRAVPTAQIGVRLAGDAFALLAGMSRALAEILSKGCLQRFRPSTVALSRFGIGLVVGAVACSAQGGWGELRHLTLQGWLVLFALGSVCTSLSMAIYLKGLSQTPAHVAVSLRLLGSVVTVGFAWAILAERLDALHIAGIAILLAASYVIVMRAARPEAPAERSAEPAPAPSVALSEPWTPSGVRLSLKLKVAALIVAIVFATMFTSSYLSVQHTEGVVRREIRVLMAQIGATVAQLLQVPDAPSSRTTAQYLDRIVRQDIVGPAYSVRIIFIAALDRTGHVIAFATNPRQLTLADASGRDYERGDARAAQQLVTMALSGELDRKYDLVTVQAVAQRENRQVPLVVMGCQRSVAQRAEEEVRNRAVFLTLTFVLLGIAVAIHVAGSITRSLERLSRAMRRVQAGDLEVAVVPEGNDEIQDLAEAFNAMVGGLRAKEARDQAFSAYVSRQVADRLTEQGGVAPSPGQRKVTILFADLRGWAPLAEVLGPQELLESLRQYFDRLIEAVAGQDGVLDRHRGHCVMAVWGTVGEEQDDALRAVLAAVDLTRALQKLNADRAAAGEPPIEPRIGVNTGEVSSGFGTSGDDVTRLEQAVVAEETAPTEGQEGAGTSGMILLGPATYEEVAEHVVVRELPPLVVGGESTGAPVYLLLGLAGEPPLYADGELAL